MATFLTLDEIKAWLKIELSDTTHDVVLNIINDAMEESFKQFTETDFALHVDDPEIHDANESDVLLPFRQPIVSVKEIQFFTLPDGTGGQLIDANDYQVREDGIYFQNLHTPFRRSRVKVTYTWGYDGVPADVILALYQAVEAEFRRKGKKTLGGVTGRSKKDESERSSGDGDTKWDKKTGLPMAVVAKLTPYKRFEFANSPMANRNI